MELSNKVQVDREAVLLQIKTAIREIIPDAKIYLFGSRARGDWHEESDWDILVLTVEKVDRALKNQVHKKVYPVSLQINDFINYVIVSEQDWNESASYYVLYMSIKHEMVPL